MTENLLEFESDEIPFTPGDEYVRNFSDYSLMWQLETRILMIRTWMAKKLAPWYFDERDG